MIHEELKIFIEQNCSGVEPSEAIMEVIASKIEQYGADGDEVLAYVEECSKGLTLKEKRAEEQHHAEREADRLARIEEAKLKAISDSKNAEMAADKALTAMANAETKRAEADSLKEKRHQQDIADAKRKSKRRTYIVAVLVCLLLGGIGTSVYLKLMTGKSVARLASDASYNAINSESIDDIEVSTDDVPSDDPSVVIDANGDIKKQLEKYYDLVYDIDGGFYKIKKQNLYGIADKTGKIIKRPKYDEIFSRNKLGLIKITKDKKIGFLNLKGIEVIAPKYSSVEDPKNGLIKVEIDGKYGFLNATNLQEVTPCIYSYIYDLKDNKYKVLNGTTEGYLNRDGSLLY